ncbi:MAG: segregation and condensation protein A [Acidobacteriaceae bacterium]
MTDEQRPIDEPTPPQQENPAAAESSSANASTAPAEAPAAENPAPADTSSPKTDQKPDPKSSKSRKDKPREEENAFPFSVTVGKVYDGPLDLLLDLIRKQDIDIYDIPIARITAQFLSYVEHLKEADVDTAGEFIYMAALLIHIKSKMLLPRLPAEIAGDEQDDPRRELVERLLEHERFKRAAEMLAQKQQIEAAVFSNPQIREFRNAEGTEQEIAADTMDLARVFRDILERIRERPVLNVDEDTVTVGQMIDYMRRRLVMEEKPVSLRRLLGNARSERTLIAMFLAMLELVRLQAVLLFQPANFTDILIKKQERFEEILGQSDNLIRDDWT